MSITRTNSSRFHDFTSTDPHLTSAEKNTSFYTSSFFNTPELDVIETDQYRFYDGVLAVILCFCLLIGFPTNLLAFLHFRSSKKNLSTILYMAASFTDMCTSVVDFPLVISLFNKREPKLFAAMPFCKLWYYLSNFFFLLSMFIVTLLSTTRTISIYLPFYRIKKSTVLVSLLIYSLYTAIWSLLQLLPWSEWYYAPGTSHCEGEYTSKTARTIYNYHWTFLLLFPPVIVVISFLVSTTKLLQEKPQGVRGLKNRQASITIAYFTAVFLVCNLPTFLNTLVYSIDPNGVHYWRDHFFFFYSWIISDIVFPDINAAVNPIIYIFRMEKFRMWMSTRGRARGSRFESSQNFTQDTNCVSTSRGSVPTTLISMNKEMGSSQL